MLPPQPGMKVLDIGCGTGSHLRLYQQAGCEVFGIDTSPSMLQQARQNLDEAVELYYGDASRMPYPDHHFDLILSSTVLHEMAPAVRSKVLDEAKRVLKRNGRILIIDFHPGPLKFPKGWFYKAAINIAEFLAGREHFKNSRQFLRNGGLLPLVEGKGFVVINRRILTGGNMIVCLLRPQ